MVREYIGARYVPKFMGNYDVTQDYEALCVVDNGLGTSYISKIPTPAGTPLTDTTYWAIYGASSGAIINLQNQIDDMNDGSVSGSLQDQINDNASDIQDIQDSLKKHILIIGNSYVGVGCTSKLETMFEHSYKYLDGGAGFLTYSGHTKTFEGLLDDAINDSGLINDLITDIIFVSAMGDSRALNELGGVGTFKNALSLTLASIATKIANNFTNCKRVSVTLAETRKVAAFSTPDYPNTYRNLFDTHLSFIEVCQHCGFDYIGWSGFNSLFVAGDIESDNYHPTAAGADVIGQFIYDAYYGNAEYIIKKSQASCDFGGQSGKKVTCVARITPDNVSLNVRLLDVDSGSVSFTNGSVLIDTSILPIPFVAPDPSFNMAVPFVVFDTGVESFYAYVLIDNNSDGVGVIKAARNGGGTVSTSSLIPKGLEVLSYNI